MASDEAVNEGTQAEEEDEERRVEMDEVKRAAVDGSNVLGWTAADA